MANYIKIPISTTTGIPLATSGAIVDTSNWDFSAIVTVNNSQSSGPLTSSNSGTGSGAQFTFTTNGAGAITVTVNVVGNGYVAGDVLTVTVPNGASEINGDASAKDVTITLTEAMLASVSDAPEELRPIDNVMSLQINGDNIELYSNILTAGNNLAYWTCEIDSDSSDPNITDKLILAVQSAVNKAIKAPNSQPSVVFPGETACYNVTYTST